MIIVKVINQRVGHVVIGQPCVASQHFVSSVLATRNQRQLAILARTLVQSAPKSQKVTKPNNQQLIPIARNISFRQCQTTPFISRGVETYILIDEEDRLRESPLEALKRKARDAVDRRESAIKSEYYGQKFDAASAGTSERRLVVLLSWLQAREKHIEKYRKFYLDRGFDVLNVKTSPLDLLLPNRGARKISEDFVRFLLEKQYSNVVVHGFSVGGYMFGRFLLELDSKDKETRAKILDSVKGLVFDSLVPLEGTCVGVANSITQNRLVVKVIEQILRIYLFLGHNIATKYFEEASRKVWGGPLRCPTLFLLSKDDIISDHKIIERLETVWRGLGVETDTMLVESSPHVQLFSKHHEAYVNKVGGFLKKIKLS